MVPSRRVGERGRDLPSPRDHLSTTSSQHFRESRQQLHVTAFNFIDDDDSTHYPPPPEQQQTTTMPQAQPELKKVREPFLLLRSAITTSLLFQKARSNGRQDASYSRKEANFSQSHIQYLDKRVEVQLNGSRKVMGTLRGYDVRRKE